MVMGSDRQNSCSDVRSITFETTRLLSAMATTLAGVIALAFPAVFFAVEYKAHIASMAVEARFGAIEVSDLINKNPEFWKFEDQRLESLLRDHEDEGLPEVRRLLDLKGAVIFEIADQLAMPVVVRSADLLDSGKVVGRFEVTRSLAPLLLESALMGLFGLLLGGLVLVVLMVYPLRALKRALETLASEKKHAELILKSIGDGVITMDTHGTLLSSNPAARNIFGYESDDMLGQNVIALIWALDGSERGGDVARHLLKVNADGIGKEQELVAQHRDGRRFPLELRMTEFELDGERRFLASVRDISERKQARDELIQLNAGLEHRVEQRTEQMQAAIEELEAFSFSVSHDLRAPLTTIGGFSNLLTKELHKGEVNKRVNHFLARIDSGVVHMSGLIEALLRLAQLSRTPLSLTSVDLSALAQQVIDGYQEREPGRKLQWLVQPGMLAIGDPQLLRQVLENLLGNAWKFSGKQDQVQIEFQRQTNAEGETVYVVQDHGAGFDMAYADKLFSAFQRLHSDADFSGTGIGLATVQRIIARHGGRVWGQSEPGRGATFSFTLEPSTVLEAQA
jgi:PAS domain S-box-containing protein